MSKLLGRDTRIFEYLSMGKPVIAPDTRGIRDYYNAQELAFVMPGDARSLEKIILDLYETPALREQYLITGEKIYNAHRWELQAATLINTVEKLAI